MKKILGLSSLVTAICIAFTMLTGCSTSNAKQETRTVVDITGKESNGVKLVF